MAYIPLSIGSSILNATEGSVLFAGPLGVLAQDNTNLFWNDADNSLILAATPPASAVKASLRLGAALVGGDADGTFLGINAPNAYAGEFWRCQVNGTTLASLNASSNTQLGIGPGAESVSVPGAASALVLCSTTGDRASVYFKQGSSSCTMFLYADGGLYIDNDVVGSVTNWRGAGSDPRVTFSDNPRLVVTTVNPANMALQLVGASGQTEDLLQCRQFGGVFVARIRANGAGLFSPSDAGTNTILTVLTLGHNTSGSVANGFGNQILFQLEDSTDEDQDAGAVSLEWADKTHASRSGRGRLWANYTTTPREVLRFEADATNPLIGFLGGGAVAKQTSGANLTNNVTSGGTSDQIDNWTDLTTYATDAAAIRNAVYQLARKVKQLNDGLRNFSLFT